MRSTSELSQARRSPLPSATRSYLDVHTDLLDQYLDIVNAITPEQAVQPVNHGDDQRTLAS